jgi:hypothetical protein
MPLVSPDVLTIVISCVVILVSITIFRMNHRRASTGGAVASTSYPNSPEKVDMGYQEEGDSDDNGQVTTTIITYTTGNRTTRRASFSGPITRRRNSNHHAEIWITEPETKPEPTKSAAPHKGINPDVVARMSVTKNSAVVMVEDDDDDDVLSPEQPRRGYVGQSSNRGGAIDIYGLHRAISHQQSGNGGPMQRRGSNASSVHSRSSRASQRRRSSLDRRKFVSKDPMQAVKIYSQSAKSSKSDPDSDDPLESEDEGDAAAAVDVHFGYESDANESESERSQAESMSSSKRSRSRRNSCLIRPETDSVLGGAAMVATTTTKPDEEEEDDPDSLFQRAIRRSQSMDNTTHAIASLLGDKAAVTSSMEGYHEALSILPKGDAHSVLPKNEAIHDSVSAMPKSDPAPRVAATPSVGSSDGGGWRKEPLTLSYAPPTEENLKANLKHMLRIDKFSGTNIMALSPVKSPRKHGTPEQQNDAGWGDLTMQALKSPRPSEEESSDDSSYGASMYVDSSKFVIEDVDMYHQKARRRASVENTFVDIDTMMQHSTLPGGKVPHFKPAEGCRNASDFVVRCFTARMRVTGFAVLKHNRSRWAKAKQRIIYLLPDHQTLSWRPTPEDGTLDDGTHQNKMLSDGGPKIDLSKCLEVRHSSTIDPKAPKKRGTAVLRSRCKEDLMAAKSFSLVFANRTLDLTAFSNDQCKVMMEGFSALCFRLHLQKAQQGHKTDVSAASPADDFCSTVDDNDWASTRFGGSTTNTTSSTLVGPTPWGY